jgi:hypothetical protein
MTWPVWYITSFVQVTKRDKPLLNLQALKLKSIIVKEPTPKTKIEYLKPIACTIPGLGELKLPYNIIHICIP